MEELAIMIEEGAIVFFCIFIALWILAQYIKWLYIKSAVKEGTKEAIEHILRNWEYISDENPRIQEKKIPKPQDKENDEQFKI